MRKLVNPRVYSADYHTSRRGKYVSIMLGVAFDLNQRQALYWKYLQIKRWHKGCKLLSERVDSDAPF